MSKKTLILSNKQLNEIIGYDNINGDVKLDGANETFVSDYFGDEGEEYFGDNLTTDDFAKTTCNNNGFLRAVRTIFRESKKKISEESEHGNAELNNKKFGANNQFNGASYNSATVKAHRVKTAQNKLINGTPEEKEKASNTLNRMYTNSAKNGENLNITINNIDNAKKASGNDRKNKVKNGQQVINKKTNNKYIINYFG